MPDYPLLVFPSHTNAQRLPLNTNFSNPKHPDHKVQVERIGPQLEGLQSVMQARTAQFKANPIGIEPEEVLVIEIAGSVTGFLSVCKNTEGLEWMADHETTDLYESEHFYRGNEWEDGKPLRGRLLLAMSNQEGINNLLAMWKHWENDKNYEYERGIKGFKKIFSRITQIRRWGIEERFSETGVIEDWQFELEHGRETITFEIELWYKKDKKQRKKASENVIRLITDLDGEVLEERDISQINYHALLVSLSNDKIQDILSNEEIEIVKCDQIMFFRPTGQMVKESEPEGSGELQEADYMPEPPKSKDADLAILDGLPLQNHNLLKDQINIHDPHKFEEDYPANSRIHGTTMASIVLHGDLNEPNTTANEHPIYIRPILKFDPVTNCERVPQNRLLVGLVYDIIIDMFDHALNYGDPAAPNVKVINFSIGDFYRPFFHRLSSLARLIDWASFKYEKLFLISAGNFPNDVKIHLENESFDDLDPQELQSRALVALYEDQRNRRLISPAESINAITVGSTNEDKSQFEPSSLTDLIVDSGLPSPINPVGSGFSRSVKPEVLMPGGKILYRNNGHTQNEVTLRPVSNDRIPPGIKVAYPGANEGDINSVAYTCGTSNATAMTSNFALNIIKVLRELNEESDTHIPEHRFPILLKTLINHTSNWGDRKEYLKELLDGKVSSQKIKDATSKLIGFGSLTQNRAYECDVNRVSILGWGTLSKDSGHLYHFPVPTALSGKVFNKKFIITLAWFSPINCNEKSYRRAHLYYLPPENGLDLERGETHAYTSRRGTVQHEVFTSSKAEPVMENQTIDITISCRQDSGTLKSQIPYGLCMTLETTDQLDVPIYEQVRSRISIPEPIIIRTET